MKRKSPRKAQQKSPVRPGRNKRFREASPTPSTSSMVDARTAVSPLLPGGEEVTCLKRILDNRRGKHNLAISHALHKRFDKCDIKAAVIDTEIHNDVEVNYPSHTDKYTVVQEAGVVPKTYEIKWENFEDLDNKEHSQRLKLFLKVIEEQLTYAVFDADTNTWSCEDMTAAIEYIEDNGYVRYEEPDDEEERKISEGDASSGKKAVEKGEALEMALQLGDAIFEGVFNQMYNSSGRNLMTKLIESAAYVCLGKKYKKHICVEEVTTANPHHGFPVINKATMMKKTSEKDVSDSMSRDADTSREGNMSKDADTSSCSMADANSLITTSPLMRKTKPQIFPDAIVIRKSRIPEYFMVVVVKAGAMCKEYKSQVICQMLGAGIHQKEVLGVILSVDEARLLRMRVTEPNIVKFHQGSKYKFTFGTKDKFCNFFIHLVALLDYALNK